MKLKYRRIYASAVVLFFLLAAPVLILYTAGYNYDFQKGKIVKTGVLVIDSDPSEANIILNGRLLKKKTPTEVKNLAPGEYTVEIQKTGFYSWKKTFSVFPKQASLTNKVELLKNSSPSVLAEENVSYFTVSPQGTFLAYFVPAPQDQTYLTIKKISDNEEIIKLSLSGKINFPVDFSKDENYLFISEETENHNNYFIVPLKKQMNPLNLDEMSNLAFTKLQESPNSEDELFALNDGKLYQLNLKQKKVDFLFEDGLEDFLIIKNTIYYVCRENGAVALKQISLDSVISKQKSDSAQELLNLPLNGKYTLANNDNGIITLQDQKNGKLSIIEPKNKFSLQLKKLDPEVTGFLWSPDQKKILFYNDFELWVLDLENDNQELLSRFSEKIQGASWIFNASWILFQQANKIKAIEADGRDKRNIVDLTETKKTGFSIDNNKNTVFFLGQNNHPGWLYKLELK